RQASFCNWPIEQCYLTLKGSVQLCPQDESNKFTEIMVLGLYPISITLLIAAIRVCYIPPTILEHLDVGKARTRQLSNSQIRGTVAIYQDIMSRHRTWILQNQLFRYQLNSTYLIR